MSGLSNGSTGQSTIINIVEGTFKRLWTSGLSNMKTETLKASEKP